MDEKYNDLELEKQLITTIIKKNFDIDKTINSLEQDCFFNEYTKKAFKAIKQRHQNNKPIGPASLHAELKFLDKITTKLTLTEQELKEATATLKELKSKRDEANTKAEIIEMIKNGASKEDIDKKLSSLENNEEWPDPLPFVNHEVEELPTEILPDWLDHFTTNVAESTQSPASMSVLLTLSILSLALANKGIIKIKRGYTEPLLIWSMSVLGPGNRKSPVVKKFLRPVYEYEEKLKQDKEPEIRHSLNEKKVLEDRLSEIKKVASKTNDSNKRKNKIQEMNKLSDEIEEIEIPASPTLLVSDVTNEKLAQIMENNNGRAAVLEAEGGPLKNMRGQYNNNVNLEIYKKSWTGNEPIKDDRMGRKGTFVRNPALTMGIMLQPQVLEDLKDKRTFKGEGILARFLYAIPESPVGKRLIGEDVPELEEIAENRYKKGMHILLNTMPEYKDENGWKPNTIDLSRKALELRNDFARDIENKLKDGGELENIRDWGSKLVGNVTRVAGLLHIASQIEPSMDYVSRDIWERDISAATMEKAILLGYKLIPHAKKVYDLLDNDREISLTRYVLKRIKKGIEQEQNNELMRDKEKLDKAVLMELCKGKKEIRKPADLDIPLKLLQELNYIDVINRENEGRGRNPAPLIRLNPKVK